MSGSTGMTDATALAPSPMAAPADVDPADLAHVTNVVAASGSSFTLGMKLLRPPERAAMFAIYAFCREVDDVADEPAPEADKLQRLAAWRAAIDALYRGQPDRPTTRALAPAVTRYDLPAPEFHAMIDGMEMDAREDTKRLRTLDDLTLYCRRVAGSVGCLSMPVFSRGRYRGSDYAVALGEAFQLTNILRDVEEDAARDRLYIPLAMLEAEGVVATDRPISEILAEPGFARVYRQLLDRARQRFAEADRLAQAFDREALRPAKLMGGVYRAYFRALDRRGWVPGDPLRLSKPAKLWAALSALLPGRG